MNISILNWTIVVIYLLGVVGLGCRAGFKAKRTGSLNGESVAGDYFMAAHTLKWPVIGLALFATNISYVHLVSLAQSGYDTGLLNGNFEWKKKIPSICTAYGCGCFLTTMERMRHGLKRSAEPAWFRRRAKSNERRWTRMKKRLAFFSIHPVGLIDLSKLLKINHFN